MQAISAWRAFAGLAVVAASIALAAPAQAAVFPLVAGAEAKASAAPGGVFEASLSVTNVDTVAVDGAAIWSGDLYGYASAGRFANCSYSTSDELQVCHFDQILEPGRTYRVDLPLRVPADAYAPGRMTATFDWLTGRQFRMIGGHGPWTTGDGETLRLVEVTDPGTPSDMTWQYVDIKVTGEQGADLAVEGAKVYGTAGDVVQAKVSVRSNGPATLDWVMSGASPGLVIVTIPPGTSVQTRPPSCSVADADLKTRPDEVQYACETPKRFTAGDTSTFTFGLRIDQLIVGATGPAELNPACHCQRFADDLDKSNDTAALVVNPAPTAPGGTDTNPPVVSSTGLTAGQWLGQYPRVTPVWSDDVGVTKVQVLFNGVVTKTYEGTLPSEVEMYPPSHLHHEHALVTIRAFDAAGNAGERSTQAYVDLLRPEATVTPAFGSTVSGTVTFRASDVDADTVRIIVLDPAGNVVAESAAAPWTMTWDSSGVDGDQFMAVQVIDRADNATVRLGTFHVRNGSAPSPTPSPTISPNPVPVDTTGPVVSSISPAHRTLVRGSVRTTIRASDPSGIRSVRVTGGRATSSPMTWTVTPKAQGAYTIEWVVTDKRGNTTVARRVVVNDTVAPALKLTKAPKNNAKLTKKTTLTASASDVNGVAKVQLLVDGKVVATDTKAGYRFTLNPKKYGKKFTVQVRAYDKAGNVKTLAKRAYRR